MVGKLAGSSQSDAEVWSVGREWLGQGRVIAIATVIDTWGSAPVPVGGQLVVADDQSFQGSVSGGCVENDVIFAAGEAISSGQPSTLSFGVSDETAWRVGLPCGGRIRIFVERYHGAEDQTYLGQLIEAKSRRRPVLVETRLNDGVRRAFFELEDMSHDYRERLRRARSDVVSIEADEIFLHTITPGPRILIVGGTHIAQALVRLAGIAGYDVVVIDPRSSYASNERFSGIDVVQDWPSKALDSLEVDPYTAVVALAHVADIDDEALRFALSRPCGYVGVLGSKRSHAKRVDRLRAAGLDQKQIEKIRAPIGLDIGAFTPAEIALAILAEIVRDFRGPRWQ